VRLVILVEEKDLDKTGHAMESLKRAMRWDEERFGREYDLDVFHIVAVDDFNMGAMENKSLNIFNTSCVLASPETTTDLRATSVSRASSPTSTSTTGPATASPAATGSSSVSRKASRCSATRSSPPTWARAALKRVEDAGVMRTLQFAEDAGPMAHPVRPASFIEISNFYTLTVYEKGAEVVRMLQTLLGR
jgi:aminopeptidase N